MFRDCSSIRRVSSAISPVAPRPLRLERLEPMSQLVALGLEPAPQQAPYLPVTRSPSRSREAPRRSARARGPLRDRSGREDRPSHRTRARAAAWGSRKSAGVRCASDLVPVFRNVQERAARPRSRYVSPLARADSAALSGAADRSPALRRDTARTTTDSGTPNTCAARSSKSRRRIGSAISPASPTTAWSPARADRRGPDA